MDMHGLIMNLPCEWAMRDWSNTREAYIYGHRDARHAAAELALTADAEIERRRALVTACRIAMYSSMHFSGDATDWTHMIAAIDAALTPNVPHERLV